MTLHAAKTTTVSVAKEITQALAQTVSRRARCYDAGLLVVHQHLVVVLPGVLFYSNFCCTSSYHLLSRQAKQELDAADIEILKWLLLSLAVHPDAQS